MQVLYFVALSLCIHSFQVIKECESAGAASTAYIVADMSNLNQTKSVIDKAVDLLGKIMKRSSSCTAFNHTISYW